MGLTVSRSLNDVFTHQVFLACPLTPLAHQCDERHPACLNCLSHGVQCPFLSGPGTRPLPSAAATSRPRSSRQLEPDHLNPPHLEPLANGLPTPALTTTPISPVPHLLATPSTPPVLGDLDHLPMLELELLHNFTTLTYTTLAASPAIAEFWRVTVVQVGLRCSYIMRSILALSALHLAYHRPAQRDRYTAAGIELHRRAARTAMGYMGFLAGTPPAAGGLRAPGDGSAPVSCPMNGDQSCADNNPGLGDGNHAEASRTTTVQAHLDDAVNLFLFSMLTIYFALASPRRSLEDGSFFIATSPSASPSRPSSSPSDPTHVHVTNSTHAHPVNANANAQDSGSGSGGGEGEGDGEEKQVNLGFPDWTFLMSGAKSLGGILGAEGHRTILAPFLAYGHARWVAVRDLDTLALNSNSDSNMDLDMDRQREGERDANSVALMLAELRRRISTPRPKPKPEPETDPELAATYTHALDELEVALSARRDEAAPRDVLDAMLCEFFSSCSFLFFSPLPNFPCSPLSSCFPSPSSSIKLFSPLFFQLRSSVYINLLFFSIQ